jgi:Rrf2 family transcriptional regulator, cysteine metabolism repressor
MKIFSEKIKYSILAMLALAKNYSTKTLIQTKNLATDNQIPQNFLEQILLQLKRGNLVVSVRGAQGGYKLNKPPENISILEIIEKLEGTINLIEFSKDYNLLYSIFNKIQNQFEESLNISLQDMLDEEQKINETIFFDI